MSTHQLALALFEEKAPTGETIVQAPAEVGFRRNNIFVEIVDLSLSARRAIDVAYFIVAQDQSGRKNYEVDLDFFRWLMDYNSNNRKHLRTLLREAQKAAFMVNVIDAENPEKGRWTSVPLLGVAEITDNKVFFEVAERLQALIKTPANSHFLSLRFVFKSLHAKVIYDRLQPYLADECTPWYDLDTLRQWLGCTAKTYDEFKYLKRSVLELAIKQINEVSDLEASYDTQNVPGSKKVALVRFCVKAKARVDPTNATMLALKSLYETLQKEFGLSRDQFNEIMANREEWTDARLVQAIDYTRFNVERGKVTSSAAGYFMRALKEHYVVGTADRLIAKRQAQPKQQGVQAALALTPIAAQARDAEEVRMAEAASRGLETFKGLPAGERAEVLAEFCRSPAADIIARRAGVPKESLGEHLAANELVRRALGSHVFERGQRSKPKARKAP